LCSSSPSKQPAAIVLLTSELTQVATDSVNNANLPVEVNGISVTIDSSGGHLHT
jgi:hypothetical protein